MTVVLTGNALTIAEVGAIALDDVEVTLSEEARAKVRDSEANLAMMIADGTPIYGVTTGFGALDGKPVAASDNGAQQCNLLRSHAAGVGAPMSRAAVRAMMAIRANVLATGLVGVQSATLDTLVAMLNAGVTPRVPVQGSVGACGDLAPLAHMALPMIGEGKAAIGAEEPEWLQGVDAMARAGIEIADLRGRDGIALINGTEQTTGIGCLTVSEARRLVRAAEFAAALTMEALGGLDDSFDRRVALSKPHPGQIATSQRMRELTENSIAVLAPRPGRLRDALSLRCIPQVLGATRDAIEHCAEALTIEINAANDNPLFGLVDGWVTSNSGNFHGQRAGEVLDFLANSIISLAVVSERRSARMIDIHSSGGLPAFLIHPQAKPGVNSGFMIAQYTAASLVAELRMQAIAASIQSVPTCANTEDHVPMSPLAARRAASVTATAMQVVAIELLLACQAIDLRDIKPAPRLRDGYRAIREHVPVMVQDREMGDDIAAVHALVEEGVFS